MTFKAVFTDMDGTLLGPDFHVSQYTKEVLQKLHEKKIPLILATGRPVVPVLHTIDSSGLHPDFLVTTNGGRIHDKDRNVITRCDIEPSTVKKLLTLRRQPREDGTLDEDCPLRTTMSGNVYVEDKWLTDDKESVVFIQEKLFYNELRAVQTDYYSAPLSTFTGAHQLFFYSLDTTCVQAMKRYIEREFGDTLQVMSSHPTVIDVVRGDVDKGHTVRRICEMKGLKMEEVVAFGDSMNDAPMLQAVPHSFIMANALPALREALPDKEVILSNKEDGVAKKLVELFNL